MDIEMAPRNDDTHLPFPGGVEDGQVQVQYLSIALKKPDLSELCRRFGLSVSGKKDELKARLRAFSANTDEWQRFIPTARRMHRGPKMGTVAKSKSVKQSTCRAHEIFSSDPKTNNVLAHLPSRPPVNAVHGAALRSQQMLAWAKAFSSAHPYISREERAAAGRARLERMRAEQQQQLAIPLSLTHGPLHYAYANARLDHIAASLSVMSNSVVHGIHPSSSINLPVSSHGLDFPALPITPAAPDMTSSPSFPVLNSTNPDQSHRPHHPAPYSGPVTPSLQKTKMRTIKLQDGTVVEFSAEDVGPAPLITFADDLKKLNSMWDDAPDHWCGYSALVIKGVPIPIVYWREVYGRSKAGPPLKARQWRDLKGSWGEWKAIIKQWRHCGSEQEFWSKFSDDSGNKLSYTAIVDRLSSLRAEEDHGLAEKARDIYGDKFAQVFCYKKNGQVHVKQRDRDIAKQYLEMLRKQGSSAHLGNSDMDVDSD